MKRAHFLAQKKTRLSKNPETSPIAFGHPAALEPVATQGGGGRRMKPPKGKEAAPSSPSRPQEPCPVGPPSLTGAPRSCCRLRGAPAGFAPRGREEKSRGKVPPLRVPPRLPPAASPPRQLTRPSKTRRTPQRGSLGAQAPAEGKAGKLDGAHIWCPASPASLQPLSSQEGLGLRALAHTGPRLSLLAGGGRSRWHFPPHPFP